MFLKSCGKYLLSQCFHGGLRYISFTRAKKFSGFWLHYFTLLSYREKKLNILFLFGFYEVVWKTSCLIYNKRFCYKDIVFIFFQTGVLHPKSDNFSTCQNSTFPWTIKEL